MDLVLIFDGKQAPAMMAKEALEEAGIEYLMKSDHGEGFVIRAGGLLENYYIYVQKENEERARELVRYFNDWTDYKRDPEEEDKNN